MQFGFQDLHGDMNDVGVIGCQTRMAEPQWCWVVGKTFQPVFDDKRCVTTLGEHPNPLLWICLPNYPRTCIKTRPQAVCKEGQNAGFTRVRCGLSDDSCQDLSQ